MSHEEIQHKIPTIVLTDSDSCDETKESETNNATVIPTTSIQSLFVEEDNDKNTKPLSTEEQLKDSVASGSKTRSKEMVKILPLLPEKSHHVLDDETRRKRELTRILEDHERTLRYEEIYKARRKSSGTTVFRWDTHEKIADPVLHMATRLSVPRDSSRASDRLRENAQRELDRISPPSHSRNSSLSGAEEEETATTEQQQTEQQQTEQQQTEQQQIANEESDRELMESLNRPNTRKNSKFALGRKRK